MSDLAKTAQRLQNKIFGGSGGNSLPTYVAAVIGGAFLGGVALALLNRKTIQDLREKLEQRPGSSPDDIY